jgi:preprotein translocase subunit SecE
MQSPKEYLNKAADFFHGVEVESKRVTWPSLKETVRSTGAVVLISAILAAFLGLVDFLFSIAVKFILSS